MKSKNCKSSFVVVIASLLLVCNQAWGQSTETDDGNPSIVIETPIIVSDIAVPEIIVQAIEDAIAQFSGDPVALQQAIRAIIQEHASGQENIAFATAITAIAASRVSGDSQLLTAIALGASQGNPGVSGASMIASIPELRSEPGPEEVRAEERALSQATVENPANIISPTTLGG